VGEICLGWGWTADPSASLRFGRDDKGEVGGDGGRLLGAGGLQVPPLRAGHLLGGELGEI
jgi:hypothetical protein